MRSWEWLCAPENGGRPPGPTGQPGNPINEVQAPGLMTDPVLTNAVECGGGQPHPHHTQEKASEMCTSSLGGWVRHQSLSTLRAAVPWTWPWSGWWGEWIPGGLLLHSLWACALRQTGWTEEPPPPGKWSCDEGKCEPHSSECPSAQGSWGPAGRSVSSPGKPRSSRTASRSACCWTPCWFDYVTRTQTVKFSFVL